MKERVLEFYKDWICFLKANGFTMEQIGDYLYEKGEISYIERDLIKEGE